MYDVIIVGSGASGVASALELSTSDIKPLMLDVGYTAEKVVESAGNLYKLKAEEVTTDFLCGDNFEYFDINKHSLPSKLKSPYFDFVTKGVDFFNIKQKNYNAITSYAKGGLANAWGNGLMRFSSDQFDNLPISLEELIPYYEKLENEIGISGTDDDLVSYFGEANKLQEPLRRSKKADILFQRYEKNRKKLNSENIYMGTPRIGVSHNKFDMRDGCKYDNMEFWQPNHNSLYSPQMTLEKLTDKQSIEYMSKIFVDSWNKVDGYIEVIAYHVDTKEDLKFKTKKLVLACGTVNTSRIVLKSRKDHTSKLKIKDNPAIQAPIFFPKLIGDKLDTDCFGLTQLNLFYNSKILNKKVIGALLEITSPSRTEFIDKFPFSINDNINFIKYFLPSMMVCQFFLPAQNYLTADLFLDSNGDIVIEGTDKEIPDELVKEAIKTLRKIGYLSLASFAIKITNGNGIHYGGTLPMRKEPTSPYHTTTNGELSEDSGIFIVDGACFEDIPATNYSLSIMANAMRITSKIKETL